MKSFNKLIIGLSIFLLGLSFQGNSQIFAPEADCVFGDTIFWQPAINTCGPFVSTDIYVSNFPFGPFTLEASITDPSITKYFDFNPTFEDRFYFLQSNHNCPGEILLSSDTISNLPLEDIPLDVVTVNNNQADLFWTPNASIAVSGYYIFKITPTGAIPIDTIFGVNNTAYTDFTSSPNAQSESYFVIAFDPCNNTSNFVNVHRTIFLEGEADGCDEVISLNWSTYKGWVNPAALQEVHLAIAGGPFNKVADVLATDTSYALGNISSGLEYCVKIIARESISGFETSSNIFCIEPNISEPVTTLQLENLSVRTDNTVDVSWYWDDDIDINSFEFRSGTNANELSPSFSGLPGIILGNETTRIDPNVDASSGPIFFRVATIDDCGREFTSNLGSTIFLRGVAAEQLQNQLSWSDFFIEGAVLTGYRLFRSVDVDLEEIVRDDPLTTDFVDIADPTDPDQAELCYYVEAEFNMVQPSGLVKDFAARSNRICLRQESNIYVPNAFMPNGVNSLFKPLLVFDEDVTFNMKIYNRWGALIFETDDYLNGWDGRMGLQEMPMGGYVYVIKVVQPDGVVQERSGTVVLIR